MNNSRFTAKLLLPLTSVLLAFACDSEVDGDFDLERAIPVPECEGGEPEDPRPEDPREEEECDESACPKEEEECEEEGEDEPVRPDPIGAPLDIDRGAYWDGCDVPDGDVDSIRPEYCD